MQRSLQPVNMASTGTRNARRAIWNICARAGGRSAPRMMMSRNPDPRKRQIIATVRNRHQDQPRQVKSRKKSKRRSGHFIFRWQNTFLANWNYSVMTLGFLLIAKALSIFGVMRMGYGLELHPVP